MTSDGMDVSPAREKAHGQDAARVPSEEPTGPLTTGAGTAILAIPGSAGELFDKITILEIKEQRIGEPEKLAHIRHELALLNKLKAECGFGGGGLAALESELRSVNGFLWEVEDALRGHEARRDFGAAFVEFARQVYKTNDRRAALKKEINLLCHSAIVEEKSYFAGLEKCENPMIGRGSSLGCHPRESKDPNVCR
ncbi:MAG TPA: DUF6165 family protein [Methylocella sp.]|nr:DUF6165 family protein [Methylocella sp.]